MDLDKILTIVSAVLGALTTTIIPLVISLAKAIKSKNVNDMLNEVNKLITAAEDAYKAVDNALKAQGSSSGALKKDSVMAKLQAYAINKGYKFDSTYWDKKIDEIVEMTRNVNAK